MLSCTHPPPKRALLTTLLLLSPLLLSNMFLRLLTLHSNVVVLVSAYVRSPAAVVEVPELDGTFDADAKGLATLEPVPVLGRDPLEGRG